MRKSCRAALSTSEAMSPEHEGGILIALCLSCLGFYSKGVLGSSLIYPACDYLYLGPQSKPVEAPRPGQSPGSLGLRITRPLTMLQAFLQLSSSFGLFWSVAGSGFPALVLGRGGLFPPDQARTVGFVLPSLCCPISAFLLRMKTEQGLEG